MTNCRTPWQPFWSDGHLVGARSVNDGLLPGGARAPLARVEGTRVGVQDAGSVQAQLVLPVMNGLGVGN